MKVYEIHENNRQQLCSSTLPSNLGMLIHATDLKRDPQELCVAPQAAMLDVQRPMTWYARLSYRSSACAKIHGRGPMLQHASLQQISARQDLNCKVEPFTGTQGSIRRKLQASVDLRSAACDKIVCFAAIEHLKGVSLTGK